MRKAIRKIKEVSLAGLMTIVLTQLSYADTANAPEVLWRGFEGLEIIDGEWQVTPDGKLGNKGGEKIGGRAIMGSNDWMNYTFEVTYDVSYNNSPPAATWSGLIVRYKDSNNYIQVIFPRQYQQWYIEEYTGGQYRLLDYGGVKIGKECKLMLECMDETIIICVDGKKIVQRDTSGSNYRGKVGFLGVKQGTTVFSKPVITSWNGRMSNVKEAGGIEFNERLTTAYYVDGNGRNNPGDRILAMIGREVNIAKADRMMINIRGDGQEHCLGIVLTDNSGEKHFIGKRRIRGSAWREYVVGFGLFQESPIMGVVEGTHWGGDGNQKIDFPIKRVELGLFDAPRGFMENSGIDIGKAGFYYPQ